MKRSKRRSSAEWFEIVKQFESSGMGPTQFCQQHNLSTSVFYKWLSHSRKNASKQVNGDSPFIEIKPKKAKITQPKQDQIGADNLTLTTPSGCTLSWSTHVNVDYIAQLIGQLQ